MVLIGVVLEKCGWSVSCDVWMCGVRESYDEEGKRRRH